MDAFLTPAMKSMGLEWKQYVKIPIDATDYAPYVAQLTNGSDCILGPLVEPYLMQLLPALEAANAKQQLFASASSMTQKVINLAPEEAQGTILSSSYSGLDDPSWNDYRAAVKPLEAKMAEPKQEPNTQGRSTWVALEVLKNVAANTESVDKASLLDALGKANNVDVGLIPPLDYTKNLQQEKVARLFNRSVFYGQFKDGAAVIESEPTDLTDKFLAALGG